MWKWLLLTFALSFCVFAIQSGDVMMYLSLARDFILEGNWAQTERYLYPATDGQLVWIHEYLSHLIFYGSWHVLGPAGLILLKTLTLGVMFWIALRSPPRERTESALWIMLFALAVIAGSFRFIERASMFSDLFTVLTIHWLLTRERVDRALVTRLTVLFLVWVQLHPGYVAGLVFLSLWAAWRALESRDFRNFKIAWLALPFLAVLINPHGLDGALYPIQFSLNEAQTLRLYNFEWFPSTHRAFRLAPEVIAFWILSLACFTLFVKERSLNTLRALFAFVAFAMALQAVRFIPWAAMALIICVKPVAIARLRFVGQPWLRTALALALTAVTIQNLVFGYQASSGERIPRLGWDPKFFPTKTLEFLRTSSIPGRLYNSHDLGSQLVWAGITPIFHHGFVTDMRFFREDVVAAMSTRERFQELEKKHGWTMLLVDKSGSYREFYRILSPLTEWKIVAEDEAAYLIYKLP